MRDREVILKSISDLMALGLTQEEAMNKLKSMFRVRLLNAAVGSKLEGDVLDGITVLNDLIRDTEKN